MMKEAFLHYVWNNRRFQTTDLKTVSDQPIWILDTGQYAQNSGVDFNNAQIFYDDLRWVGSVEIHLKSSDWYIHKHHDDRRYDNVILHVVWEHDVDVFRKDNSPIPVLSLKNYVEISLKDTYMKFQQDKKWIFCEEQFASVASSHLEIWKEQLFKERLQQKAIQIKEILKTTHQDWEAVLFLMLAKNFGLNVNGTAFLAMAQSIPFSVIRKEASEPDHLEALFMGRLGLLHSELQDCYALRLYEKYKYLCLKHELSSVTLPALEFFKHRPDNFPTIRLAQLARLYQHKQTLFDQLIHAQTIMELRHILRTEVSDYWKSHYIFDKESPRKNKSTTTSFLDLLVINTVIPFLYVYQEYLHKKPDDDKLKRFLRDIRPEKNMIIDRFKAIGATTKSAYDTQALLYLKKEYCQNKRCLDCNIGKVLLDKV